MPVLVQFEVDSVVLIKPFFFLEYTYFSRLAKVFSRILEHFFMFFLSLGFIYLFFNPLNFYPVTRFLVTPLLVTRYCVTLFSNTRLEMYIVVQSVKLYFL